MIFSKNNFPTTSSFFPTGGKICPTGGKIKNLIKALLYLYLKVFFLSLFLLNLLLKTKNFLQQISLTLICKFEETKRLLLFLQQ